jgi:hypothetical protein
VLTLREECFLPLTQLAQQVDFGAFRSQVVSQTFHTLELFWVAAAQRTFELGHVALLHVALRILELVLLLALLAGEANLVEHIHHEAIHCGTLVVLSAIRTSIIFLHPVVNATLAV